MNLDDPIKFTSAVFLVGMVIATVLTLKRSTRELGLLSFLALSIVAIGWVMLVVILGFAM